MQIRTPLGPGTNRAQFGLSPRACGSFVVSLFLAATAWHFRSPWSSRRTDGGGHEGSCEQLNADRHQNTREVLAWRMKFGFCDRGRTISNSILHGRFSFASPGAAAAKESAGTQNFTPKLRAKTSRQNFAPKLRAKNFTPKLHANTSRQNFAPETSRRERPAQAPAFEARGLRLITFCL